MDKVIYFIILTLLISTKGMKGQEFNKDEDYKTLTLQIISLDELKDKLVTDKFESTESIFVEADINYVGPVHEIFNSNREPPYYIWHPETLFFYDIDFWLKPKRISINNRKAIYKFVTCSWVKQNRTYYIGTVRFKKENGTWIITKKKIKKTNEICLALKIEK